MKFRWPLVWRSTLERADAERAACLKTVAYPLFVLEDVLANARSRVAANIRLVENRASANLIDIALKRAEEIRSSLKIVDRHQAKAGNAAPGALRGAIVGAPADPEAFG